MPTLCIESVRQQFPMLQQKMHGHPLIYFDSGATTLKPHSVIRSQLDFYEKHYGTVHRSIYPLTEQANAQFHGARVAIQELIGALSEKEIIFTSGTTDSINKCALSLAATYFKPGDEVLISEAEHHSNLVPWQLLQEQYGIKLRFFPIDDEGQADLEQLKKCLNPFTKLVSLAHISNVTGAVQPIKEIVRLVREHSDAKVLVDGAQAVSHQTVNVHDLDVDFYVFSAHKLYGPTGVGVWYGKEKLLNEMKPAFGGGDMIKTVELTDFEANSLPYKFEAGTPNIAGVIGLKAAVDFLKDLGLNHVAQHEHQLTQALVEQLQMIPGVSIIGGNEKRSSLVSFYIKGVHNLDLATLLGFKGVAVRSGHLCAQTALKRYHTQSLVRVSFGCYNTISEVHAFIDYLKLALAKLKD